MYTLRNVTQKFSKAFLSLSIHHGTHRKDGKVILFTPQEKYGLLYASSYETHKCQQCYTRIFHTQFQANRRKCIESKGRDALNPQRNVWLSLRRYSRNSDSLSKFCGHFLYGILSKRRKNMENRRKILFTQLTTVYVSLHQFPLTLKIAMELRRQYRILSKSEEKGRELGKIYLMKVWLSLCRFSQKPYLPNSIMCTVAGLAYLVQRLARGLKDRG